MHASVVFEPRVVKTSAIEVRSVVPVEIGTIVLIVNTVAVVTIPNRVVVIHVPGEFRFIDNGGRRRCIISILIIISVLTYGSRCRRGVLLINYGRGRGGDIHSAGRNIESYVDRYLRISGSGKQGAGEDRGKNK
jgi:hypothetical protein